MKIFGNFNRAIAASAPILQFTGLTPCDAFNRVVTADYATTSSECAQTIRNSWKALDRVLATGLAQFKKKSRIIFKN